MFTFFWWIFAIVQLIIILLVFVLYGSMPRMDYESFWLFLASIHVRCFVIVLVGRRILFVFLHVHLGLFFIFMWGEMLSHDLLFIMWTFFDIRWLIICKIVLRFAILLEFNRVDMIFLWLLFSNSRILHRLIFLFTILHLYLSHFIVIHQRISTFTASALLFL